MNHTEHTPVVETLIGFSDNGQRHAADNTNNGSAYDTKRFSL